MTDPLAVVLATALSEAQRGYRCSKRLGSLCTPAIPKQVIDRFAEALLPVLRELVREAVTQLAGHCVELTAAGPEPLLRTQGDINTGALCMGTAAAGRSCALCRVTGVA